MKTKIALAVVTVVGLLSLTFLCGMFLASKTETKSINQDEPQVAEVASNSVIISQATDKSKVAPETEAALQSVGYTARTTVPVKVTVK